jgi:hypothetical protein
MCATESIYRSATKLLQLSLVKQACEIESPDAVSAKCLYRRRSIAIRVPLMFHSVRLASMYSQREREREESGRVAGFLYGSNTSYC